MILVGAVALANTKEVFLNVGGSTIVNHKEVRLENVGSGGAIVVNVGGVTETIAESEMELVNGIEILNYETFYEDNKDQRSARIKVTFPEVDEFCSNEEIDSETEEKGIDCGGPYCPVCPTCDDRIKNQDESDIDCGGDCKECSKGRSCNSNDDCISDVCSKKDVCCPKIKQFICEGGKLISKGADSNECSLGYTCCGDDTCDEIENEDNCYEDCFVCEGCLDDNNNCLNTRERTSSRYCDADQILKKQEEENKFCLHNYECISNFCDGKKCMDSKEKTGDELIAPDKIDKGAERAAEEPKFEKEVVPEEEKILKESIFKKIFGWLSFLLNKE